MSEINEIKDELLENVDGGNAIELLSAYNNVFKKYISIDDDDENLVINTVLDLFKQNGIDVQFFRSQKIKNRYFLNGKEISKNVAIDIVKRHLMDKH